MPLYCELLHLQVEAGTHDRSQYAGLTVDPALKDATYAELKDENRSVALLGQVTTPSLLAAPAAASYGKVARELHFVLPDLKAGETANYTVTISSSVPRGIHSQDQQWKLAARGFLVSPKLCLKSSRLETNSLPEARSEK